MIAELAQEGVAMLSCRLSQDSMVESMMLESVEFKFIEMVLHPFLSRLSEKTFLVNRSILIEEAKREELEKLSKIAEVAFINDRFSVDLRLPPKSSSSRYKNWVLSCENHPSQKIFKFTKKDKTLGFFIIEENFELRKAYWHLTAIAPEFQGQGLGNECWNLMLEFHKSRNINKVSTTISARNTPVLNLYSKLNFRFQNPETSFHWINQDLLN